MSTLYKTKGDITANIEYTSPVTVTENDGNTFAKIENNGTNNVTVTATQPTKVTMKWTDNGAEKSKILNITNNEIKPIKPKVVWDYDEDDVVDGCIYGEVTAKLVDETAQHLLIPQRAKRRAIHSILTVKRNLHSGITKIKMILWVKIIQLRLM